MNPGDAQQDKERLAALEETYKLAQAELSLAEQELAERKREIFAFEAKVENRIGDLVATLAALEEEIKQSTKIIEALREERIFGKEHGFKDPNYWRNWADRPEDAQDVPQELLDDEKEAQIKDLYRQLAREFHPDLAEDERDQAYRAEKMAALNEAFNDRELAALKMLAVEARLAVSAQDQPPRVKKPSDPQKALEYELSRCQRRTREVRAEIDRLHQDPGVQLSLDVKLARREGRDLLREMAADLRQKIARKNVERDYLKSALEQLDQAD